MSRIVEIAAARGEFWPLEDGFIYYWPKKRGALSAGNLRELADELDRRNEPWSKHIDRYFRENTP